MPDKFTPTLPEFPTFGPLQGVRILDSGSVIAGPWAGEVAADFGAEVIKVEAIFGDVTRGVPPFFKKDGEVQSTFWAQEARNKLEMLIDFTKPDAKEIFARLLAKSDIWIESSIPGQYPDKFGITDEWVLSVNPKLVIVHVSGFGQSGDPSYYTRASYDMMGQAFGGLCDQIGFPDGPPLRTGPALNDYITSLWALWSSLAAYIYAQKTGKGQSIDLAQYEAQFRMLETTAMDYLMFGQQRKRVGNGHPMGAHPYGIYPTKDGYIAIGAAGGPFARVKAAIPELNLEKYTTVADQVQFGQEIKAILETWLSTRTTAEAEADLVKHRVPVSAVMDMPKIAENSQYKAREMIIEWDDPVGGKIRGTGVVPKFSETPGQVWRGAPTLGQDTDAVLTQAGFSASEIAELKEKAVVK